MEKEGENNQSGAIYKIVYKLSIYFIALRFYSSLSDTKKKNLRKSCSYAIALFLTNFVFISLSSLCFLLSHFLYSLLAIHSHWFQRLGFAFNVRSPASELFRYENNFNSFYFTFIRFVCSKTEFGSFLLPGDTLSMCRISNLNPFILFRSLVFFVFPFFFSDPEKSFGCRRWFSLPARKEAQHRDPQCKEMCEKRRKMQIRWHNHPNLIQSIDFRKKIYLSPATRVEFRILPHTLTISFSILLMFFLPPFFSLLRSPSLFALVRTWDFL